MNIVRWHTQFLFFLSVFVFLWLSKIAIFWQFFLKSHRKMNKGIRVIRKSELRWKKVKFLCVRAHQFQFSSLVFALYRLIFFKCSKITFWWAFQGTWISCFKTSNFKIPWNFVTLLEEWSFHYSTKRNKIFFFYSIGVYTKIIMHLTVRLLIQIPRFKSKFCANISLLEKMVFSLSNLRQQRLLKFSFNLNVLLREV